MHDAPCLYARMAQYRPANSGKMRYNKYAELTYLFGERPRLFAWRRKILPSTKLNLRSSIPMRKPRVGIASIGYPKRPSSDWRRANSYGN